MRKVLLAPPAKIFIEQEIRYLRDRNPAAVAAFRASISRLGSQLVRFPRSGFLREDIPLAGVHRIVFGDYRADYELMADAVLILLVRHGRQAEPGLPVDDDTDYEVP
ncbi:type II toxin-antitoxin system RelE/ParE family toxin [Shinella curvata]|uniref:Type II toxin-antitoxin system RelE/ParE family toxin n=1 Tax=Shinella curvata TaxID=1817964 RepID=A0ABT8XFK5_9HYPH|nr:type II toxin-antitoxin system RelE/ParE family toxin [Shinella curvata]MCJ8053092.1 type II toxin-antitoxin system RelE/ParE family toxin [Shinella curvata]MDO6122423.1 type II toxin-antitoxin system RelE/ParE family toxin [Shinella curvata]